MTHVKDSVEPPVTNQDDRVEPLFLSDHVKKELEEAEFKWTGYETVQEVFDAYLTYNGIIGFTPIIMKVFFDILTSSDRGMCADQTELREMFGLDKGDILR